MKKKSNDQKGSKINALKPLLVVLSGPSGTGKSTIVNNLLKMNRDFRASVSATTRARRAGERHGRDYFFMTHQQFRNKMRKGEFIESAEVFTELYGTPRDFVQEALRKKKIILFDIDIQGGMAIKKWRKDAVLIFIRPPSLRALRKRLMDRHSETAESMRLRMSRVLKEIQFMSKYDYVVCNADLRESVALIASIIKAESQRVSRCAITNFQ